MIGKQEQRLFILAILLTLVSRASAFVSPTFNVDDLWLWASNFDFDTAGVAFREGRFTGPFLYGFQYALGVNSPRSFALSAVLLTVCLAASSVMVCRIWKIQDSVIASALVVALLTQHPYQTDFYTWKIAMLSGGFPFVMTMWALIIAPRGVKQFAFAVALIVLAFGIHQIPLEFAAGTLVLAVPICLARGNFVPREWMRMVAALSVGTVIYVVAAKLTIHYTVHFESVGRDKLIVLSNPRLVLDRVIELADVFAFRDPLTGWLSRALLAVLAMVGFFGILGAKRMAIGARVGILLCFIVGLAAAFLCAIALTVVPAAWMPAFRNMMAMGLVWGSIVVVAYFLSGPRVQKLIVGVACLMLLGFMGMSGEILSDQQRANSRDFVLMSRVSGDIEQLPDFANLKRIAFVGTNTSPLRNLRTGTDFSVGWYNYGTTLSVFSVWWPGYLLALYNEVNGSEMGYVQDAAELAGSIGYCETAPKWPARGAIKSMGEWAIVCIGPYRKPDPGRFE